MKSLLWGSQLCPTYLLSRALLRPSNAVWRRIKSSEVRKIAGVQSKTSEVPALLVGEAYSSLVPLLLLGLGWEYT